jgi:hypothetical protein
MRDASKSFLGELFGARLKYCLTIGDSVLMVERGSAVLNQSLASPEISLPGH